MDNKTIAGLLYETADLLEIDGQDSFRVRSYRNAAAAIESLPQRVADLIQEPKKLLEVPGVAASPLFNAPIGMTRSISRAPRSTARTASAALISAAFAPCGNPTTVQTLAALPARARVAAATQIGCTQAEAKP